MRQFPGGSGMAMEAEVQPLPSATLATAPWLIVASQPGRFQREHSANFAATNSHQQCGEPGTFHKPTAGLALIFVDHEQSARLEFVHLRFRAAEDRVRRRSVVASFWILRRA